MDDPEIHRFSQIQTVLSTDPETQGFDLSSGKKWIYPENYPIREYQYKIVEAALYKNTLVCLPTGLGKTFIAAVLMYNFWRWYPRGKVVFMAPTKPLVAQQINACHEIMGIPSSETIELTGSINQKQRKEAWVKKRIIFATPQIFHNDLEKEIAPVGSIKCIVFDEAHKALGKYAYCESIRILNERNKYFRVLALSATPGNKTEKVQDVVKNLLISHLELRTDLSPDIRPHINERECETVVVALSRQFCEFKNLYIEVMDPHVKKLINFKVLRSGNTQDITKGKIYIIQSHFQRSEMKGPNHGCIMQELNIMVTMAHAYELMVRNGLRAFHNFYENHKDKYWLKREDKLQELLKRVETYLGPFPDITPMPDGSLPEIPKDIIFGHDKFEKTKELLSNHFKKADKENQTSRAIVFVEYRYSANEVYLLLLQLQPLIRPQVFVGQAGQKQKQQIQALKDFKNNEVNVLISTSVGEEGLDVGEVDLIICFDASQNSPSRLVQRMGRTGRQRSGKIYFLVTPGKEYQTLKSMMNKKDTLNNKVLESSYIASSLYQECPRMLPPQFKPECHKTTFVVQPKTPQAEAKRGRKPAAEKKKPGPKAKSKMQKTDIQEMNKIDGQFTMQKYLKRPQLLPNNFDDLEMPSIPQLNKQRGENNKISSSNIKLLKIDSLGEEFMMLCAMKNSEKKEKSVKNEELMNYIPASLPRSLDIFMNYKVPNLQIVEQLNFLTDDYVDRFCERNKNETNDVCNIRNDNLHYTMDNNDLEMDRFLPGFDDIEDAPQKSPISQSNSQNASFNQAFLDDGFDAEMAEIDFFSDLPTTSNRTSEKIPMVIEESPVKENVNHSGLFDHLLCSEESNESAKSQEKPTVISGLFDHLLFSSDEELAKHEPETSNVHQTNNVVNFANSQSAEKKFEPINEEPKPSTSGTSRRKIVTNDSDEDMFIEDSSDEEPNSKSQFGSDDIQISLVPETQKNVDDEIFVIDDVFDNSLATARNETKIEASQMFRSIADIVPKTIFNQPNPKTAPSQVSRNIDFTAAKNGFHNSSSRNSQIRSVVPNGISSQRNAEVSALKKPWDLDFFNEDDDLFDLVPDIPPVPEKKTSQQSQTVPKNVLENHAEASKNIRPEKEKPKVQSRLSHIFPRREQIPKNNKPPMQLEKTLSSEFENDSDFETSNTSKYFQNGKNLAQNGFKTSLKKSNSQRQNENRKPPEASFSKPKKPAEFQNDVENFAWFPEENDDDDFFTKPAIPHAPKKKNQPVSVAEKDVKSPKWDREKASTSGAWSTQDRRSKAVLKSKVRARRKRQSGVNPFFEDEAEVCCDVDTSDGSTDGSYESDDELSEFVSHTQHVVEEDMHAHYMRTVRSPKTRAFHSRPLKEMPREMIFSQAVPQDIGDYENDSFCVDEDEDEDEDEMSHLEYLENMLKKKKKKNCKRQSDEDSEDSGDNRRKKKKFRSDSSSEDEVEKMRRQIL